MPSDRMRPLTIAFFFVVCAAAAAPAPAVDGTALPLAVVGEDTLTTTNLRIELAIMRNRNTKDVAAALGDPEAILRRMTQNELVIQEGYRMGMAEEFAVRNQVREAVRNEIMKALLDSVAAAVPVDTPELGEARRAAVDGYLEALFDRFAVQVDSLLLADLDYGSSDPATQKRLQESTEVLATVGGRRLTVSEFSRAIRFKEFHGMVGKPDAAARRDKILREWVAEAVLTRQALAQKMDELPEMVTMAARLERNLVLEEALNLLVQFDFDPAEEEIEAFWRENAAEFTPPPRVRMQSLKVGSSVVAQELHEKLLKGATIRWLASNDERVVKGPPPFPEDWFRPEQLGLKPDEAVVGFVGGPYQVPTGWVVAVVSDVEPPVPTPLESCRNEVLRQMKARATREHMIDILARLEEVSPVRILPGAVDEVAQIVMETEIENQRRRQNAVGAE